MDCKTAEAFINDHDSKCQWKDNSIIYHGSVPVDLSVATGKYASTPPNAPDQPTMFPPKCHYRFDTGICCGPDSFPLLRDMLKKMCPSSDLTLQQNKRDARSTLTYVLVCNSYFVKKSDPGKPKPKSGYFTSKNVVSAVYKKRKSRKVFDRMKNPKMRSKDRKHTQDTRSHTKHKIMIRRPRRLPNEHQVLGPKMPTTVVT